MLRLMIETHFMLQTIYLNNMSHIYFLLILLFLCSCNNNVEKQVPDVKVQLYSISSGSNASFRSIAGTGSQIWIGGTNGTLLCSKDQGINWQSFELPGADSLDFRDIAILDEQTVLAMTVGNGNQTAFTKPLMLVNTGGPY